MDDGLNFKRHSGVEKGVMISSYRMVQASGRWSVPGCIPTLERGNDPFFWLVG